MAEWKAKLYKGNYPERQKQANKDGAVCYLEMHLNSSVDPKANGTEILIAHNASETSYQWARLLAEVLSLRLGTQLRRDLGVYRLEKKDRGNSNLQYTSMPAILCESLFISNPDEAELLRYNIGAIADCILFSIQKSFPQGGLVALSIGHKYKTSAPNDRGAGVAGGGFEADFAEKVVNIVVELLKDAE